MMPKIVRAIEKFRCENGAPRAAAGEHRLSG
jgi:hypothetical protein